MFVNSSSAVLILSYDLSVRCADVCNTCRVCFTSGANQASRTHLLLNKMAILQTWCIFVNEKFCIWLTFHWSIGLDNGLALYRRQAISWINAEPIHWRIYAALGGDELKLKCLEHVEVDFRQASAVDMNSLQRCDASWHKSWSSLVQVIPCCLNATKFYLNHWWQVTLRNRLSKICVVFWWDYNLTFPMH